MAQRGKPLILNEKESKPSMTVHEKFTNFSDAPPDSDAARAARMTYLCDRGQPRSLARNLNGIPQTLKGERVWAVWRYEAGKDGDARPVLYGARASGKARPVIPGRPGATYDAALSALARYDMDGLCVSLLGDLAALILHDAAGKDGSLTPWAREALESIPAAWMWDPLGRSLVLIGKLPGRTPGRETYGPFLERVAGACHFIPVTGHVVNA